MIKIKINLDPRNCKFDKIELRLIEVKVNLCSNLWNIFEVYSLVTLYLHKWIWINPPYSQFMYTSSIAPQHIRGKIGILWTDILRNIIQVMGFFCTPPIHFNLSSEFRNKPNNFYAITLSSCLSHSSWLRSIWMVP